MKFKKCHTVGTVPKFSKNIVGRGNFDTCNTRVSVLHDHSFNFLLSAETSRKGGGIKQVLCTQTSPNI